MGPVSRSAKPRVTPDGLAISYDPPSSYFKHEQADMGWDNNNVPISRDAARNKPFTKAYDPVTDTSNRFDSVLDAYANMYVDYAQDDSPGATPDPEPSQRREPWDSRGKTGLYGGGGRGADDSETGWISDSEMGRKEDGRGEEDLRYDDAPTPKANSAGFKNDGYGHRDERRRSSAETQSSYGPVTPVSATFEGYQHQPHQGAPGNAKKATKTPPARPIRAADPQSVAQAPVIDQSYPSGKGQPRSQAHPGSRPAEGPPIPTRSQGSSLANPTHSSAEPGRLRKKTISNHSGSPHPTISAPTISVPQPLPPPPPADFERKRPMSTEDAKRRKSVAASFLWGGKSKKMPVISNPILPQGFVESLGMETFALTPGCSVPAHDVPPKPKKEKDAPPAPRPKKQPPLRPSHPVGTAQLVRTPMDALRDAGASTPQESSPRGHPQSKAEAVVTQPTKYQGKKVYSRPAFPPGVEQRGHMDDSAYEHSGYSDVTPHLDTSEESNSFHAYSPDLDDYYSQEDSSYLPSEPTAPLNLRRPSAVPMDSRQSIAGSVVWGGSTPRQSSPPPPMPSKQQDDLPGGVFRNPFEVVSNKAKPARSGWQ
ncbi:hypothetical protein T439DRAFT_324546 [Meredithblackwellia eburnea MCA 4105]